MDLQRDAGFSKANLDIIFHICFNTQNVSDHSVKSWRSYGLRAVFLQK